MRLKMEFRPRLTVPVSLCLIVAVIFLGAWMLFAAEINDAIVTITKDGQQVIFVVSSFISMKIYNDVAPDAGAWPGGKERRAL